MDIMDHGCAKIITSSFQSTIKGQKVVYNYSFVKNINIIIYLYNIIVLKNVSTLYV